MKDYGLDMKSQMILDEYNENLETFAIIKEIVLTRLQECLDGAGIRVTGIEARIKSEESLAGKLELKGWKYSSLSDLTDIVGARVITFYSDEVDKIAALAEKLFDVDRDKSVDKRRLHEIDSFGYLSLHYICSIPESMYCDPAHPGVNKFQFELQMRTALQHVWANMYHDIGYKSGVDVPTVHLRNLTRLAGMLELADEQFSRIRTEVNDYRRNVQALVADGSFDEVALNVDTFRSYIGLDPFKPLLQRMAALNQAEVYADSLIKYLPLLQKMGFRTLGDVERMRLDHTEAAYNLAVHQIGGTDLDIISESLPIQNLLTVYILSKGAGESGLEFIYRELGESESSASQRAGRTYEIVRKTGLVRER